MFEKFLGNSIYKKNFYFLFLLIIILWFIFKNPDIAFTLFISLVFACSLNPLVDRLSNKMSRSKASAIVLFCALILILLATIPILMLGAYQVGEFAKAFPSYIDNLDDTMNNIAFFKKMGIENIDASSIVNSLSASSSDIIKNIINIIENASSAFFYIISSIVITYFFMADKDNVKNAILRLFPSEVREQTGKIIDNISEKLSGYILAQTLVCGSVWITMTLGLLIFKVPYAIILGVIAGIMAMIPVVGSAISLIICLVATYDFGVKVLVIVTVLFSISHIVENNIVRPYVYSKLLDLHQIIIFVALLVGAKYAGVMGVLFAPPIAMALYILLEELFIKKMD